MDTVLICKPPDHPGQVCRRLPLDTFSEEPPCFGLPGQPEATMQPARACTRLGDRMQPSPPSPPGSLDRGLGSAGRVPVARRLPLGLSSSSGQGGRGQTTRSCKQPHAPPPGAPAWQRHFTDQAPGSEPPPNRAHYLRTTCSDTLMLRHRKASAAELSLNSLTGGELFKPCLGGLAILKLPGEEGRPKPQRAQLPGGESKPLEG